MNRYKFLFVFILTGLLCLPYLKADQQTDDLYTRRFAFLVGANHGGEDRVTLRYAVDDAKAVQKVLEEMGGILPDDSCFLANPSRDVFFKEIKTLVIGRKTFEIMKQGKEFQEIGNPFTVIVSNQKENS